MREAAAGAITTVQRSLRQARREIRPFRHWLPVGLLPPADITAICALPVTPPAIGDTRGKRETNNATRYFFSADARAKWPVAAVVTETFQCAAIVDAFRTLTGARLDGSFLRIEYCQDAGGFWLEPHTDIGAKLLTVLIYLSGGPGTGDWGTDLYDGPHTHAGRAPFGINLGLIFVPGTDTWHGFERRPIGGIRRSLIVNYVKDEWRARHELAFPDSPVA